MSNKEEEVQITGLEILTDDQPPAEPKQMTDTAPRKPQTSAQKTARPAPAFIRGGKKPIARTRSLPRSFQRPATVPDQAKNVQLSPVRRGGKPKIRATPSSNTSNNNRRPSMGNNRRPSMGNNRRSSMGNNRRPSIGAPALPRVSRRVSIENTAVGVTQTSWGQKPQRRRSSMGGSNHGGDPQQHGNYHWASTGNTPTPADDNSASSNYSDYMLDEDEVVQQKKKLPERLPLSLDRVVVRDQRMSSSGRENDDISVMTDYSYANDSLDLRKKQKSNRKLDRFIDRSRRSQRQQDEDSFGDDTYANDSLDLRNYNKKKLSKGVKQRRNEGDFEDDFDDADTAMDSLDLRNKQHAKKLPRSEKVSTRSRNYEEEDDFDDADTAVDSLDLRNKQHAKKLPRGAAPSRSRNYEDDDEDDFDDGDTAVDSLDLRNKQHAKKIDRKEGAREARRHEDDYDDDFDDVDSAVDSLDLRNKQHARKVDRGGGRNFDDDGFDDVDTAVDSLDLRNHHAKKLDRRDGGDGYDEEADFDDLDTAVDSLDLRNKQHARKVDRGGRGDFGDDDDEFDDADTAVDSLDLRRNNKLKLRDDSNRSKGLDDSAASSLYSYGVDSVGFSNFRKTKSSAQKARALEAAKSQITKQDLGYGDAAPSLPSKEDLGYGDAPPTEVTKEDLGYGDVPPSIITKEDLGYEDAPPSREELGYGDMDEVAKPSVPDLGYGDGTPTMAELGYGQDDESYDVQSYAMDSIHLRRKQETTSKTETTEDDSDNDDDDSSSSSDSSDSDSDADDEDEEYEDTDSNKTPVDYMTKIVMGYKKEEGGKRGSMLRRMSNESEISEFSYAENSVAMMPRKKSATGLTLSKPAAKANREGFGDDCSDYSTDDSDHGNHKVGNPYLPAMLGQKDGAMKAVHVDTSLLGYGDTSKSNMSSTSLNRRGSCNSYSNDSVDLRVMGDGSGRIDDGERGRASFRRESIDSLASGVSAAGIDPEYLNDVLGYALQEPIAPAPAPIARKPKDLPPPRPRDMNGSQGNFLIMTGKMMDSMTSIGSGGDWALSPSLPPQRKASLDPSKITHPNLDSSVGDHMQSQSTIGQSHTNSHSTTNSRSTSDSSVSDSDSNSSSDSSEE